MIVLAENKLLLEKNDVLPEEVTRSHTLYLDFETSSGSDDLDSLNPWINCETAGVAVTVDQNPKSWYVPIGHVGVDSEGRNLDRERVVAWLTRIVRGTSVWVNHNIKYDAHVLYNDLGIEPPDRMLDTLTMAKIFETDREYRGGYGLKILAWQWCGTREYADGVKAYLNGRKNYGLVPPDTMGRYACEDVLSNRKVHKYITEQLPEQSYGVAETEIKLTRVLYEMERTGLHVDMRERMIMEYLTLGQLQEIHAELKEIFNRVVYPHRSADCQEILLDYYGLPTVESTKPSKRHPEGQPSFNKHAMVTYASSIQVTSNPQLARIVALFSEYRELNTLWDIYLKPYEELAVDKVIHSDYNQAVRTGRMSCRRPNMQQLNKPAKSLIVPPPGHAFISTDASQIEFRVIVHYIKDPACIEAYAENPDTDFHQWVADMAGMSRQPAKTMNFMMGYGGGKKKAVAMLSDNSEVVGDLLQYVEEQIKGGYFAESERDAALQSLCEQRATGVYATYHHTLPSLKPTTRRAQAAVDQRGFIFNLYGRRKHFPYIDFTDPRDGKVKTSNFSHRAFNALCQSMASDLVKERMVALHEMLRGTPIKMVAQVHDEILMIAPVEVAYDPRTVRDIVNLLEHPTIEMSVPIRWDIGVASKNWKEASGKEAKIKTSYRNPESRRLEWLKESV